MTTLDAPEVANLIGRIAHDVDKGVLPAAQVALARDGRVVLFESFGTATAESRLPLYSVSKVLTAAAAWRHFGTGALRPEQPVNSVLDWFVGGGKEAVTIEHLLVHTAGLPRAPMGPPEWFTAAGRRERMESWYVRTDPGTSYEYHGTSSSWVLAEVFAELGSGDHRREIHRLVTEPLELPAMLGVDTADGPIVDLEKVGGSDDVLDIGEISDTSLLRFNEPEVRALGVPGAGGFATAADVALLYQALLHNPGRLWDPDVLHDGTAVVRVTQEDALRLVPANRTRGVIVAGEDGSEASRGFGRGCSSASFGHDGAAGQAAWADPETGLSVCFLTAALDSDLVRAMKRSIGVSTRAMACLPS